MAEEVDATTRQQVLDLIVEKGPVTASAIAKVLGLTTAAVRRHMTLLLESKEQEWTHVIIAKKGLGYGHEAMKLLKAWAFEDMGAHRAWLDCKDYNARALHLYESEGMVREALIRETILHRGVYENLVVLGILDREYHARKRA